MVLRSLICVLCLSLCGIPELKAKGEPKIPNFGPLLIPRVTRAPKLSDFLDGVSREAELEIREFLQYQPVTGCLSASQR